MAPDTIHFHIRWGSGAVDWERHVTRAKAEESARQLARPGEHYTIEEAGEPCKECKTTPSAKRHAAN